MSESPSRKRHVHPVLVQPQRMELPVPVFHFAAFPRIGPISRKYIYVIDI